MKKEDAELRKRMHDLIEDQTIDRCELKKRLKDLLELNGDLDDEPKDANETE